jgi:hypothetical protein
MTIHKYTPEELQFLSDNVARYNFIELTELFNRRFGLSVKYSTLKHMLKRRGIVTERYHQKCTPERIQFLKNNVKGISHREIQRLFNERFGLEMTLGQINSILKYRRLRKKVNYPLGSERINKCGYVQVKIKNSRFWEYKQRVVWEKEHGKIPKGHIVIFADDNRLNMDLDNLMLVSQGESAVMNRLGLKSTDKELTKTGLLIAKAIIAVNGREREIKKGGCCEIRMGNGTGDRDSGEKRR